MSMQMVDMFVGVYKGNARTWYEIVVEIPEDTPTDKADDVALEVLARSLEDTDEMIAFYGIMPMWATDGLVGGVAESNSHLKVR